MAVVVLVMVASMVTRCATDPEPAAVPTPSVATTTTVDAATVQRCHEALSDVESATAELDRVGRELANATRRDTIADLYHLHGDLTDAVVDDMDVVMDICFHVFTVAETFAASSVQFEIIEARNEIYYACRDLLAPDGFDC